jgi:WD40 repeat protein
MAEGNRSPAFLLNLAAESAAAVMAGCAQAFNAAGKAPTLDKANEFFAPRIVAQWLKWLGSQRPEEQRAAIENLASLLAPDARREATSAVRRLMPFANPMDEAILIDYLTVLPGRVKLSLMPDPQTGHRFIPPDWSLNNEQTLLELLAPGSQARGRSLSGFPPAGTADAVTSSKSRLPSPSPVSRPGERKEAKARSEPTPAPQPVLASAPSTSPRDTPSRDSPRPPKSAEVPPNPPDAVVYDPPPTPIPGSLASFGFILSREIIEKNRRARQRMLQNRLERGRPSREAAAQKKRTELDRLKVTLTSQIEENEWKSAHRTVDLMLAINPKDQDALDTRAFIEEQLAAGAPTDEVFVFSEHKAWVNCAAFLPDGRRILTASGGLRVHKHLKEDADRCMRLWDSVTGQTLQHFAGLTFIANCLAITSDGSRVLIGSRDGDVYLWDVDTGKIVRRFESAMKMVTSLAVSPDGKTALSGSDDKYLRLWDMSTGRRTNSLRGHNKGITCVLYSQDGRFALTGSMDRTIKLWDIQNARVIRSFEGHSKPVLTLALSPDRRFLLSGSSGSTIRMWDADRGKIVRRFEGHTDQVHSLAISPNGKLALSGSTDGTARLWDIEGGQQVRCYTGHTDEVRAVLFSPDGRLALTASRDTDVRLWRVPQ